MHCRALARGASVCDGVGMQAYVAKFLESFKEFPPQPGSFSIDQVMESTQAAAKGGAN